MAVTPSGVVVGSYPALVEGWPCKGSFFYATQKRRVVLFLVNRSATSGRAALRAAASSLEDVTLFQVIFILPGLDGLRIAHSGLYRVLDGLRLCLGLVDQGLQLPQFSAPAL